VVSMVPGPVPTGADTSVSIGLERFDGVWARVAEAGITVAFHSGDAGYYKFAAEWGEDPEFKAFDFRPLRLCLSANPVHDAMAAILCHGLLDRHRNLRLATIEAGSSWVEPLLSKMKKAYGQMPMAFDQDPVEAFQRLNPSEALFSIPLYVGVLAEAFLEFLFLEAPDAYAAGGFAPVGAFGFGEVVPR